MQDGRVLEAAACASSLSLHLPQYYAMLKTTHPLVLYWRKSNTGWRRYRPKSDSTYPLSDLHLVHLGRPQAQHLCRTGTSVCTIREEFIMQLGPTPVFIKYKHGYSARDEAYIVACTCSIYMYIRYRTKIIGICFEPNYLNRHRCNQWTHCRGNSLVVWTIPPRCTQ